MKYTTGQSFRVALEKRLHSEALASGTSNVRLRKLVAFDRFLARLQIATPGQWLLKGGLALDYRLGIRFRTTRDLDVSRQDHEDAATADLIAAQAVELDDYFAFSVEKITNTRDENNEKSVSYHVIASLANRKFEEFNIDISFSDPRFASPEILHTPGLLQFADIVPVEVPAIPVEQQVAEKVHAYTRIYADQRPSSRAKDLIDLALVQVYIPLNAGRLMEALDVTFATRDTHPPPPTMPPPPANWGTAYARVAREVDLSPDPVYGYRAVARLLDPALSGQIPYDAHWNPDMKRWE